MQINTPALEQGGSKCSSFRVILLWGSWTDAGARGAAAIVFAACRRTSVPIQVAAAGDRGWRRGGCGGRRRRTDDAHPWMRIDRRVTSIHVDFKRLGGIQDLGRQDEFEVQPSRISGVDISIRLGTAQDTGIFPWAGIPRHFHFQSRPAIRVQHVQDLPDGFPWGDVEQGQGHGTAVEHIAAARYWSRCECWRWGWRRFEDRDVVYRIALVRLVARDREIHGYRFRSLIVRSEAYYQEIGSASDG